MKNLFNWILLLCWALCWVLGLAALGGVSLEYALPMYMCGAALAIIWAVKLFSGNGGTWVPSPLHWPLLALLAYTAIRYATAPLRHEAAVDLLLAGLCLVVYAVTACVFYRSSVRTVMLVLLAVLLVAESVYGCWQYVTGSDRVFWFVRDTQYHGRASGSFICPNHLAGLLEIGALILIAQLLVNPKPLKSLESSVIVKLFEVITLAVALLGLFATKSRGGWLSLGAGAFMFWFWAWRTGWVRPRVADAILISLLLLTAGVLAIPDVRERLSQIISFNPHYTFRYDIFYIEAPSLEGRTPLASASWQMFRDHLWFGVGPGAWRWFFPQYRDTTLMFQPEYAHNDLLQFAAEYGLIGVAIALASLVSCFWQIIRLSHRDNTSQHRALAFGVLLAVTALLVHSAMDFNLHIPANAILVATLLGLLAGTRDGNRTIQRQRISTRGRIILGSVSLLIAAGLGWGGFHLCSAQRHMLDGTNAGLMGEWNEALTQFREGTVHDPTSAAPYAAMGDVFRIQLIEQHSSTTNSAVLGRNALTCYHAALQRNPRDATVWMRIAAIYETAGDANLAQDAYRHAFDLDPNNVYHWVPYAKFLYRTGRRDEAMSLIGKASALNNPDVGRILPNWRNEEHH